MPFVALAKALRESRLLRAGDLCRRSRARLAPARGSRATSVCRRHAAGADQGALRGRGRRALVAAPAAAAGPAAGRAACRVPDSALRPRRLPDRGRAPARLVSAAPRRRHSPRRAREGLRSRCGARRCSRRSRRRRPGCCAIIIRPTCSGCRSGGHRRAVGLLDFQDAVIGPAAYDLASLAAGRARRRAGGDRTRAARPLRARAPRGRRQTSTRLPSPRSTPRWPRSARAEDPRHLRTSRPARRQAAISASHPAGMELSAALAGASVAGAARRVVREIVPALKTI